MRSLNPRNFIIIGFVLVVLGLVLPLLMVLQLLRSTFFLNFVAYISSVLGLMLGIGSAAYIAVQNRKKK